MAKSRGKLRSKLKSEGPAGAAGAAGAPTRRSFKRYLCFTILELLVVIGIWQALLETADLVFGPSFYVRITGYLVFSLAIALFMSLIYDDRLDGAT